MCVFLYAISYQRPKEILLKLCTASCIAMKSDFPFIVFPHIIILQKRNSSIKHTHTYTHTLCVCYILFSFNCQTMSPSFSSIIFLFDGDLFSTLSVQNIKEISRFLHCLLFIFFLFLFLLPILKEKPSKKFAFIQRKSPFYIKAMNI